jgi:hypothetical protein
MFPYSFSFTLFIHPPPSQDYLPKRTCLPSCPSFFQCILIVKRGFTIVFHMNILYFNQINPLYYFFFFYLSYLYYPTTFRAL